MIIDTQPVRAAAGAPTITTGLAADNNVAARKRARTGDALGLIIGVVVPPASAHGDIAGAVLLDQTAQRCDNRLEQALAVQGFKDAALIHGILLDIDVVVVRRNSGDHGKGFASRPNGASWSRST
ncbi:hypothetical protein [Streptomyces californicus]|uniref:hypothetical protein n=1 Tax=Streptomyces californicus TaxID=67351 RepID=UPI0033CABC47